MSSVENLLPLLLLSSSSSTGLPLYFFFYFIFLIWSKKYILKVEFWSTKHQAILICYQKPQSTNTDLIFFFFQILHALFLLKIYLFSCWVLKKICGYMLCNFIYLFCGCSAFLSYAISEKKSEFGILVPTPLSLFKTSSHFGLRSDFLSLAWFGYFRNIKNEKERRIFRRNINIFHVGCHRRIEDFF